MRSKRGVLIGSLFLILVALMGIGFFYTGGVGLVRLYRNYLSQDIADKKYTWRDFTDRGASEKLSGYYAGRGGDSIFLWTLSGLKRFGYKAGSSAYYYMDICGFIRSRAEGSSNSTERVQYDPEIYFNPTAWAEQARTGDYSGVFIGIPAFLGYFGGVAATLSTSTR